MKTLPFANQIVESCTSTNDLARELVQAGYPGGTWVAAKKQTAGRGRQGREWTSQEDDLKVSVLVRFGPDFRKENLGWFPLISGVRISEVLNEKLDGKKVQVKWPNDLYVDGKKLGGMLCEGFNIGTEDACVVIGIGINCVSEPAAVSVPAISLKTIGGGTGKSDAKSLLPRILAAIEKAGETLQHQKASEFHGLFEEYSVFKKGRKLRWRLKESDSFSTAEFVGIGEAGELLIRDQDGERSLLAGDVQTV